jgi:hypothetical protein
MRVWMALRKTNGSSMWYAPLLCGIHWVPTRIKCLKYMNTGTLCTQIWNPLVVTGCTSVPLPQSRVTNCIGHRQEYLKFHHKPCTTLDVMPACFRHVITYTREYQQAVRGATLFTTPDDAENTQITDTGRFDRHNPLWMGFTVPVFSCYLGELPITASLFGIQLILNNFSNSQIISQRDILTNCNRFVTPTANR